MRMSFFFFFLVSWVVFDLFADASEKESNVKESVVKAKKAVSLDIKDGTSWSESVARD